ncbi:hypothetical protein ACTXT7_006473 [Hymenolepis weldensis]
MDLESLNYSKFYRSSDSNPDVPTYKEAPISSKIFPLNEYTKTYYSSIQAMYSIEGIVFRSPTKHPDSKSSECSQQNFCLEHRLLFRLATLMHQMDLNPRTGEVRPPPNVYPFGKGNEDGAFSYSDGEDEKGA